MGAGSESVSSAAIDLHTPEACEDDAGRSGR